MGRISEREERNQAVGEVILETERDQIADLQDPEPEE